MLYKITIYPIEVIYKSLFLLLHNVIGSFGISLIALSIVTTILILPFMRWANRMQASEKHIQDVMAPQFKKIKEESAGAERHERIKRLYYRYSYHPVMAIRSAAGVALQIPFLMGAYYMLSSLPILQGQSFLFIKDLSQPDHLLCGLNLLPIMMTVINMLSACTTKNFTTKDKIQAGVIAILFLMLLYSAPSALLIFWTCNNLWILLGNVCNLKPRKATNNINTSNHAHIFNYFHCLYKNNILLLFTNLFLAVATPTSRLLIYNGEYFKFLRISDIFVVILLGAIFLTVPFVILYYFKLTRKWSLVYAKMMLVVSIFTTMVLPIKLGIIDGNISSGITLRKEAFFTLIISMSIITLLFAFSPFVKKTFYKHLSILAQHFHTYSIFVSFLFLLYAISSFYSETYTFHLGLNFKDTPVLLSAKGKNIFVIVFDQVQGSVMKGYLKEHPEEQQYLEGFTLYSDAASTYPNTTYSLASMLLGKNLKKNTTLPITMSNTYDLDSTFIAKARYHGANVYTNVTTIHPPKLPYEINLSGELYNDGARLFLRRLDLLRHSINLSYGIDPLKLLPSGHLKNRIMVYVENIWHIDLESFDSKFVEQIKTKNDIVPTVFSLYFGGTHQPFIYRKNAELMSLTEIEDYQNLEGAKQQTACVIKLVKIFIKKLQALGVYDNSMIFFIADHGYESNINSSKDTTGIYLPYLAASTGNINNTKPTGSYNPMMLFKDFNARGSFNFNTSPVSLIDIAPTVLSALYKEHTYDFDGINLRDINWNLSRIRYFWQYQGGADFIDKDGSNKFWNALKYWELKSFTGPIYPNLSLAMGTTQKEYNKIANIGTPISFRKNGDGQFYTISGWSYGEDHFTWTIGPEASLMINLKNIQGKTPLKLRIKAFPYLSREASYQDIGVYVNSMKIATWHISNENWYDAFIPSKLVVSSELRIKFLIGNPISPKDLGQSEDSRKLGIAVKELVIEKIK